MSAIILIALPMQHNAPRATAAQPTPPVVSASVSPSPSPVSPGEAPPPLTENLAGTFTATVNAWDASAAATRMSHTDALRHLLDAGLRIKSSGHCADKHRPQCTSLQSIRYGTLMRVIGLSRDSGCAVTVTGGTETGHSRGPYSHGRGYKVDIAHEPCVDGYIRSTFPYWKTRGDGVRLYRPTSDPDIPVGPDVYADEPTHWDILFP
jgi:hypothetical protein